MPTFNPETGGHYSNPMKFSYGDGYKAACYQDWSGNAVYQDYYAGPRYDQNRELPAPHDRNGKLPSVVAPGTMYGQPFVPARKQFTWPSPLLYGQPHRAMTKEELDFENECQANANAWYARQGIPNPKGDNSGGITTYLDYDLKQMAEFVGLVVPQMFDLCASRICVADIDLLRSARFNSYAPREFRLWVTEMLNATRLPCATVLLSLSYMAQRLRSQNIANTFDCDASNLYATFTVACILGSKFLDDNTFQNNSWADVSKIAVRTLNQMERGWLMDIGHRLHQPKDRVDGFASCEQLWADYKTHCTARSATNAAAGKLKPIDTGIRFGSTYSAPKPSARISSQTSYTNSASFFRPSQPAYNSVMYPTSCDPWNQSHSASPASAQTSGPQTPNYYDENSTGWGSRCLSYPDPLDVAPERKGAYQWPGTFYSGYTLPGYMPGQNPWNCHGSTCHCNACRQPGYHPCYAPTVSG